MTKLPDAPKLYIGTQAAQRAFLNGRLVWPYDSLFGPEPPSPLPTAGGADAPVTLGVAIRAVQNCKIVGVRFYKVSSGDIGAQVWGIWYDHLPGSTVADGAFIDTSTSTGWQTTMLPTPVDFPIDTRFIIGITFPNGYYSSTSMYFDAADNSIYSQHGLCFAATGPSTGFTLGNGRFNYSGTLSYPDGSFMYSNYWVDVLIAPA